MTDTFAALGCLGLYFLTIISGAYLLANNWRK